MLRYGLEYDHSFSHHDCQAYWLRTGDKWVPIDFDKHPDHWCVFDVQRLRVGHALIFTLVYLG